MQITQFPVPTVIKKLVQFVINMGSLKVVSIYLKMKQNVEVCASKVISVPRFFIEKTHQMSPVHTVAQIHENIPIPVVSAEGHISIQKVVNIIWPSLLISQK